MNYPDEAQESKAVRAVQHFSIQLSTSLFSFRYIGYGLIALVLIDWAAIVIPPSLLNPVWEFQTLGALVERAPLLLLALLLVFYGGSHARRDAEAIVIKIFSWLCLLLCIFFVLLVPLGVVNTIRIESQNTQVLTAQYNREMEQAQTFEEELQSTSPEDLMSLVEQQGIEVETNNPDNLKDLLLSQVSEEKAVIESNFRSVQLSDRKSLLENSVKWNLGALIIGGLMYALWATTDWARQ